jgi:hypothetical protein
MKTALWILLSTLICASPLVAAAPNEDEPRALVTIPDKALGNLWINVGGFSSHFSRDKGYNENNAGLGVEYRINPDVSIMAGGYYNSVRKNTSYAAVNWQPWALGNWKLGAAIGLMDGYPALERGGTFFAALPMASWEGKRFGFNLGVIPSMPKIDGAVIVQLKFRL